VARTNDAYAYRHVMITPALRDFMLNEINKTSGIPITRHLGIALPFTFLPLSSTPYSSYNFGESLQGQHLSTIDVNSGGTLYVNKSGSTEYGNGPNNKNNHFDLESQPCSYINVYSGGTFEIGSATTSAVVRIKNGSIFDIRSGGVLRIHNGSVLVIEDGATLVFNPGATIYLQGNSAILEIRGGLTIKNNATFTFSAVSSPAGYIRFVKDGTSGTKLITAEGTNASINIVGSACGDKILEIENCNLTPEYSSISGSHYFASVTIKDGHIKYVGTGAAFTCGSPCEFSGLHLENYSGATSTKGIVTKGQATCTLSTIKFNGLTTGLFADNSVYGNNVTLDNCRFYNGHTGIFATGEGIHASNCYFEGQSYTGIDATIENNSTLTDCNFFGGSASTDQGLLLDGSGTVNMTLSSCHFADYQYGVQVGGSGTTLVSQCSYYANNDIGLVAQSGTSVDLSTASGYSGGNCRFYNNDVAIEINLAKLYLKGDVNSSNTNNSFISSNTTAPTFIEGVLNSAQSSQFNNSGSPGLLEVDKNYWSPGIPGSLDANFAYMRVPDGGGYKNVWFSGSSASSGSTCYIGSAPTDNCTVSAKTSPPKKNPLLEEEIKLSDEAKSSILIYPNPASTELTITLDRETLRSVRIYDMAGKLVYIREGLNHGKAQIDISAISNGMYYVHIETAHGIITHKLSIIR
jgi:hypothetical protein